MQFILFTNRLRWIAPFTIFIENFIVLKSLIGNRVKKSALKDADQKKKSSMRDFYCNYAHFWFLFLGGLDCCFGFFMSWIKPGSFEFVLKPRECTAIFPELDLREVT